MNTKHIETRLISAGRDKCYTHGGINPVIQRASSIVFNTRADKKKATLGQTKGKLFYGRRGTLTHFALQEAMIELEGGAGCVLYPCGAAAIANTMLAFLSAEDNVLISSSVYEPTQKFCKKILNKFKISTTWFDPYISSEITQLIKPNTRVIFFESPASITMEIYDIPALVTAIRNTSPDIIIIIDNTWSAGILFPAISYGIDISIQSGTKYLIGHSDGMIGTAVTNQRCWNHLREDSYLMGQMIDADTAYMASRGLRTLAVRMNQHQKSALHIAKWLTNRSEVIQVNHPGLPQHPDHFLWQRDFLGSSGLFSFIFKEILNHKQLDNYLNNFTYFSIAYSWGGFESLILAYQPETIKAMRLVSDATRSITGTLIRLHIGLENTEDLISDLESAFDRLTN